MAYHQTFSQPAPIWYDSSTGKVLLQHHRGRGLSLIQAHIFQAFLSLLTF